MLLALIALQASNPAAAPHPPPKVERSVVAPPAVSTSGDAPDKPGHEGVPAAELFERAVPPVAKEPLHTLVTPADYPVQALRAGQQGAVEFALLIAADGRPSNCLILTSSKSPPLDSATCRIMLSRTRFEPARDRGGSAVESAVKARIRWALPPGGARTLPERSTLRYRIAADGTARDCRIESDFVGEVQRSDEADCKGMQVPAEVIAAIRGQSTAAEPQVRNEMRLLRSPSEPWPDLDGSKGRILSRIFARIVVEQDGKVSSCTVVDSTTLIQRSPNPCRPGMSVRLVGALAEATEMRLTLAIVLDEAVERQ